MTSLMTRTVVLFLCCVIVAQCSAKDLKISFYDYSATHNGRFNNFEEQEETGQDRVELYFKPGLAPGLQKEPVVYFEENLSGNVHRMWIIVRNESSTDRILYVDYYNFTDPSLYKPQTFNTDTLSHYRREDFQHNDDCQASYEKTSEGNLIGEVNDPRHSVRGHHPLYGIQVSCDDFHIIVPISADEATTRAPYDLEFRGSRFPLIGAPEDYVNPCKDADL